jgi:hypothetical protein
MCGNGSMGGGRGRGSGGRPSRAFKITFVPSDPWVPTLRVRYSARRCAHMLPRYVQNFVLIGSKLKDKVYLLPFSSLESSKKSRVFKMELSQFGGC